jgi:outer membrane protein assembly factor BamE (lipoprotein component of BamABCDE complex)
MRHLLLVALALVAGCTRIPNNQGYIVDEELIASVQPGVDTRQSVEKALGRPTMMSQWDDRTWYYVSRNTGQRAFLRPQPTAQSILVVEFGPNNVVTKVSRKGLEQVADISPNSDKTPTLGRNESLLEDIFGNIGSFGGAPGGGGGGPQQ